MNSIRTETDIINTVECYSDMLYKIALSYTKCPQTADDILQDTFLHYMEHTTTFTSPEHKKTWLIRVTINECKKFHRLYWNRKRVQLEDIYTFEQPEHHEITAYVTKKDGNTEAKYIGVHPILAIDNNSTAIPKLRLSLQN